MNASIRCVLALVLCVAASPSQAAILMTIEGARQGMFAGSGGLSEKGNRTIAVTAVSSFTSSARDPVAGIATGQRQHKPVVVRMPLGPASPQIFAALVTNETIKTVVLTFLTDRVGGHGGGLTDAYYRIKLTNANVASRELRTFDNAGAPVAPFEEVAFTFETIQVESLAGKTMATDDWQGVH